MNFLWKKHRSTNNNLQNRIQNLQNFPHDFSISKNDSPILQSLRINKNVKKNLELFEGQQIEILSENSKRVNWWLSQISLQSIDQENIDPQIDVKNNKMAIIIDDEKINLIIQKEQEHVQLLEEILNNFDNFNENNPNLLKELQYNLSGNIREIISVHKEKILPSLLKREPLEFISHISSLIDNDFFYCYVTHVMLNSATHAWLENYKFVIKEISSSSLTNQDDLNIYEIIQHYFNWISDFADELMVNPLKNSDHIANCIEAEKKLDELLNLISEATKIAYIKEVSQNNIEAIQKLYNILAKRELICKPMLILIPRKNTTFGYRSPIDLLQCGKFVRLWTERSSIPTYSTCYYDVNLFIFEKCVISTIIVNDRRFSYNGHFWIKDCTFEDNKNKPGTNAVLSNGKHVMKIEHPKLVSLLMQLKAEHKFENIFEIEISQNEHVSILKKVEIAVFKRLSLVLDSQNN